MASLEAKLGASVNTVSDSGAVVNGSAAASFGAVAETANYVTKVILSASGTIAAAVRATLAWTKDGVANTLGIQIPVGFSNLVIDFDNHPIEGDPNTAITLTLPALGASGTGEAVLLGYTRKA